MARRALEEARESPPPSTPFNRPSERRRANNLPATSPQPGCTLQFMTSLRSCHFHRAVNPPTDHEEFECLVCYCAFSRGAHS